MITHQSSKGPASFVVEKIQIAAPQIHEASNDSQQQPQHQGSSIVWWPDHTDLNRGQGNYFLSVGLCIIPALLLKKPTIHRVEKILHTYVFCVNLTWEISNASSTHTVTSVLHNFTLFDNLEIVFLPRELRVRRKEMSFTIFLNI